MKKLKFLTISLMVTIVSLAICLSSCSSGIKQKNETAFVFEASKNVMEITENTTLKEYIDLLVDKGEMTYVADSTNFVTSINGRATTTGEYWLIYTTDTARSNNDWGTYTYENTVMGSATKGIAEQIVVDGCLYAFVISTF